MKKLFIIPILIILATVALGACNQKQETPNEKPTYGDTVIYDFESWDRNFQLLSVKSGFGDIDVNDNPDYVYSGTRSAKLRPLGYNSIKDVPYMILPTYSELFNFNYQNLTKISRISMQVYNSEEYDIEMGMGLIFSIFGSTRAPAENYILKNGWNNIVYSIDPSMINLSYDPKMCYGVYLSFERIGSRDIEDAPVLYLDEVKFNINKEPSKIQELLYLDEYEVCDFEKYYQEFIFAAAVTKSQTLPELSVVKASNYGLEAPSGTKVLRMLAKAGEKVQDTWPSIFLSQKFMDFANLGQYKNTDYFRFDIYNNNDIGQYIAVQFWTKEGAGTHWNFLIPSKRWFTVELTIGEIRQFNNVLNRMGKFAIVWGEFTGDDREFFFDNFRVDKVNI